MKPMDWLRRRSDGFWVTVVILAALVAGAVLAIVASQRPGFRNWLIADESGSTTIRNIGLLVGGVVAIALAVWRSRVAGRQAATAERGLLNERYQKGCRHARQRCPPQSVWAASTRCNASPRTIRKSTTYK